MRKSLIARASIAFVALFLSVCAPAWGQDGGDGGGDYSGGGDASYDIASASPSPDSTVLADPSVSNVDPSSTMVEPSDVLAGVTPTTDSLAGSDPFASSPSDANAVQDPFASFPSDPNASQDPLATDGPNDAVQSAVGAEQTLDPSAPDPNASAPGADTPSESGNPSSEGDASKADAQTQQPELASSAGNFLRACYLACQLVNGPLPSPTTVPQPTVEDVAPDFQSSRRRDR